MIIQTISDWVRRPKRRNSDSEPETDTYTLPETEEVYTDSNDEEEVVASEVKYSPVLITFDDDILKKALAQLDAVKNSAVAENSIKEMCNFKDQFLAESARLRDLSDSIRDSEIQLYESKQRFEQIFNTLTNAVFICDAQGNITQKNKKFASLFGVCSKDPTSYFDLFPEHVNSNQWLYMRKTPLSGIVITFKNNPIIPFDATFTLSSTPLNDKELVIVLTDLTDLREEKALTLRRQKIIEAIDSVGNYISTLSWEKLIDKALIKIREVSNYDIACFIRYQDALIGLEVKKILKIKNYSKSDDCKYNIDQLNDYIGTTDIANRIDAIKTDIANRTCQQKVKVAIKSNLLDSTDLLTLNKMGIKRFVSYPITVKGRQHGALCLFDTSNPGGIFDTIIEEDISQMMSVITCLLSTYITTTKTLMKLGEKEEFIDVLFIDYQEYLFRFNMVNTITFCRQHNDMFLKYNGNEAIGKTVGECLQYEDKEYMAKLTAAIETLSPDNRMSKFEHSLTIHFGEYDIQEIHRQVVRAVYSQGGEEFIEYQVTGMVLYDSINGNPIYHGESESVK